MHRGAPSHAGEGGTKVGHGVLRGSKKVRLGFVEEQRDHGLVDRLCQFLNVSSLGARSWSPRLFSQGQRDDMVDLTHIREQHQFILLGQDWADMVAHE